MRRINVILWGVLMVLVVANPAFSSEKGSMMQGKAGMAKEAGAVMDEGMDEAGMMADDLEEAYEDMDAVMDEECVCPEEDLVSIDDEGNVVEEECVCDEEDAMDDEIDAEHDMDSVMDESAPSEMDAGM